MLQQSAGWGSAIGVVGQEMCRVSPGPVLLNNLQEVPLAGVVVLLYLAGACWPC
jgi:hypothetical protein